MPEQKQEGIRMLEIKEIWKTFNAGTVNEKQALRGVSLTLKDGRAVKDASRLCEGDVLVTQVHKGTFTSIVKNIK